MFTLDQLDHVALSVSDPARSAAWYKDVLGLERRFAETWGDRPIMMCAGSTCLALFPAQNKDSTTGLPRIAMRHFAFRTDAANFAQAQHELQARNISFKHEDHQIAQSIYFQDPDGHQIEITTYVKPASNS